MRNLLALIITLITTTAFAQHFDLDSKILTSKQIQKIIGAFPAKGSAGEAEDFRVLLKYQETRTAADCAQATRDEEVTLDAMFGGKNGILNEDEVNRMNIFLVKAYAGAGINSHIAKKAYKRPRPYESNNLIKPCIGTEKSYAYPSGHTLVARLFARILSAVYPERAEKFMIRADQFAENRVIGGVHHPSDVAASKILGDYLAKEMIDSDDFVNELVSR